MHTDRQTDRQTERQTDRQTDRQKYTPTNKRIDCFNVSCGHKLLVSRGNGLGG